MHQRIKETIVKRLLVWLAAACLLPLSAAAQNVTYIHTDALGSPVLETNAQAQVVRQVDYRAYGMEVMDAPRPGPGYTGHYRDVGTGLVYMQQRYYDPAVGRFLSVDPVAVRPIGDNFNRYWYANNNPYRFKDPDGRDCVSADGTTTCTPGRKGDGLPTVKFPTPEGFPERIGRSNLLHHEYRYETSTGGKSDASVQQSIANDPTPGKDRPATPTGTANDASPTSGSRSALAALGSSPVKSYSATDQNGNVWTIDVTEPGHALEPGYVLRGAIDGKAITYGEGLGAAQALGPVSQLIINDVWKAQNQQNIDDAK